MTPAAFTPALAETLGAILWWVNLGLQMEPEREGYAVVLALRIGDGYRHSEREQMGIGRVMPCVPAMVGERLVVQCDLIDDLALRLGTRHFLKSAFDEIAVTGRQP